MSWRRPAAEPGEGEGEGMAAAACEDDGEGTAAAACEEEGEGAPVRVRAFASVPGGCPFIRRSAMTILSLKQLN